MRLLGHVPKDLGLLSETLPSFHITNLGITILDELLKSQMTFSVDLRVLFHVLFEVT